LGKNPSSRTRGTANPAAITFHGHEAYMCLAKNMFVPVAILATVEMGALILAVAALGFLGMALSRRRPNGVRW